MQPLADTEYFSVASAGLFSKKSKEAIEFKHIDRNSTGSRLTFNEDVKDQSIHQKQSCAGEFSQEDLLDALALGLQVFLLPVETVESVVRSE